MDRDSSNGLCASTLRVLSLLPETKRRLSDDQATWYTGPTWPRKVATKVPFSPSHSFSALSKEAETIHRPSGENCTCAVQCKAWHEC